MSRTWRGYRVTSEFGNRDNPLTKDVDVKFHRGIDLVISHKAPIRCFKGGNVLYAGFGKQGTGLGGYGNVVVIDVGGKAHLYAHLDSICVAEGYFISDNHLIGYQGNTGGSAGSHLHFEVRKTTSPSFGYTVATDNVIRPDTYIDELLKPKPTPKPQPITLVGKTVCLPSSAETWRLYPTDKAPTKGNEKAILKPSKYGGLSYKIIANPQKDVVTIQTSNFGIGNIFVSSSTGAIIK